MNKARIFAAVREKEDMIAAIKSDVDVIFMLTPNIADIKGQAEMVHRAGKKIFIHLDLAEGIGKDEYGILFAKEQGVDGIISTRTNIIKMAKKAGIFTVQRFFIVDSHSLETTVESAKSSRADMIEIMPGTISNAIKKLKKELNMPIVAGGLIESWKEIGEAITCGATAISIGKKEFWENKCHEYE